MASINFQQNEGLESYYDLLISYINQLYDYYPTNLVKTSSSKSDISEISYYERFDESASKSNPQREFEETRRQSQGQYSSQPRDVRWWRKSH